MKRLLALLVLIGVATSAPAAIHYFDSSDTLGDFRTNYNSAVSQLYALATSGSGTFSTNMIESLANVDAVASPTVNNVLLWNGAAWSNKAVAGTGDFLADGTVPMTGDLNMGGLGITNIGAGASTFSGLEQSVADVGAVASNAIPKPSGAVQGATAWYNGTNWVVNTNLIWAVTNWMFYYPSTNSPVRLPGDGE